MSYLQMLYLCKSFSEIPKSFGEIFLKTKGKIISDQAACRGGGGGGGGCRGSTLPVNERRITWLEFTENKGYVHTVQDRFLLRCKSCSGTVWTRIDILLQCRNCSEAFPVWT